MPRDPGRRPRRRRHPAGVLVVLHRQRSARGGRLCRCRLGGSGGRCLWGLSGGVPSDGDQQRPDGHLVALLHVHRGDRAGDRRADGSHRLLLLEFEDGLIGSHLVPDLDQKGGHRARIPGFTNLRQLDVHKFEIRVCRRGPGRQSNFRARPRDPHQSPANTKTAAPQPGMAGLSRAAEIHATPTGCRGVSLKTPESRSISLSISLPPTASVR